MKKFLKSPFNILSIFFAAIGLFCFRIYILTINSKEFGQCPNIVDGRDCWSYKEIWIPLVFFILAGIFHFWGKKIINKIENKQINTKN